MPCLTQVVEELARLRPHEPAVAEVHDSGTDIWTWEQLWLESGRTAALLQRLGVQAGDVVSYQIPNRAAFVVITLASLRIGAICCPLMTIFREHELAYILEHARARVLFAVDALRGRRPVDETAAWLPRVPGILHVIVIRTATAPAMMLPANGHVTWDWFDRALERTAFDAGAPVVQVPPTALAQLLFTSGTTGEPKGVLHRQDVLMSAAAMQARHLGLGDADRIFVPSPLAHQTGFLYGMWLALSLGVLQIVQEHWEPRRALQALDEWGGTFVQAATPFLVDLTEAVDQGAAPPRSLRVFVATGAAVPRALARRATRVLGTCVCGAFGTTEGCLATLAAPGDPPDKACGTDGRALRGVQIRVRTESGEVLPAGQEGLFETHSPTMFECYLNAPAANAEAYTADGWYQTGDLAIIDDDGYLRITGRVKDVINRGGEKIPVAQIEQLLYQHDAIREIAIVAMPDRRLVERACAFVVTHAGRTLDFRAMQVFLDEHRVARQYWPERLELLAELPRTASGKIRKVALRERARVLAFEIN